MANPLVALEAKTFDLGSALNTREEIRARSLGNTIKQQEFDRANQLRAFQSQNAPGLRSGDPNALAELDKLDYGAGTTLRNERTDMQGKDIELFYKKADVLGRNKSAIDSADDNVKPLLWKRALADGASLGVDVSKLPQEWGPEAENYLNSQYVQAQSVKDQLGQQMEQQEMAETRSYRNRSLGLQERELAARMQPESVKPVSVAPGGSLVNPRTGEVVFTAPNPKDEVASKKEDSLNRQRLEGAANAISKIDDAISKSGPMSTGIMALSKGIPTTPAFNLDKTIDTIKSNIGFDTLRAMREASPTGGALGQISDKENVLLQSTIASLDSGLPKEQLVKNLQDVKRHYQNVIDLINGKIPEEYQNQGGVQPGAEEEGYRFKGGDPGDPNSWEKL